MSFLTRPYGARSTASDSSSASPVMHVVGSRSEAVRLASVVTALDASDVSQVVSWLAGPLDEINVFDSRGIPATGALSASERATGVQRTASALAAAERTLLAKTPSIVVVAGDADTTFAFALAASKLGIPIAQVGGGLRNGDFSISEEINRVMGDRLADLIFTDTREASDELQGEGIDGDRVQIVGNTSVDLVRRWEHEAKAAETCRQFGARHRKYVLAALHRTENVGDGGLARTTQAIAHLSKRVPVLLSVPPAAYARMEAAGDIARLEEAWVRVLRPLGYLDFLSLERSAGAILTDSGAIQDEASALGVRCYTLGRATERIASLTHGTNVLLGDDPAEIVDIQIDERPTSPAAIPMWDGRAGERIAAALSERLVAVAA